LDINERLKVDVLHILVNVTLGVFIGDAAVKALINKFVQELPLKKPMRSESEDHVNLSQIVSQFSTESSIPNSEFAESWLCEIRKILKV